MPTGFVMMLQDGKEPDPEQQVAALVAQCKNTGRAYFLSRRVVNTDKYASGANVVGLLGDQCLGNRMLAVGTYVRAFNVGLIGRPGKPTEDGILPVYRELLKSDRTMFKQVIELRDLRLCGENVTLATLGWRTTSKQNHDVPDFQGGGHFKIEHA